MDTSKLDFERAATLRKTKKIDDALSVYNNINKSNIQNWDIWDIWSYAYCLEQKKMFAEALDICKVAWSKDHNHEFNNKLYATCIYMLHIKDSTSDLNTMTKAIDGILKLITQNDSFVFVSSIFQLVDKLQDQNSIDYSKVLDLLSKINADLLNKNGREFTDKNNKLIKTASDYEKYYSLLITTFFELKRFSDCILSCENALSNITQFHNSNDIWFKRRKAMSLAELGNIDDSLHIYHEISIIKPEFFIFEEIANIYLVSGDFATAKRNIGYGILAKANIEFKVHLFESAYNILMKLNETEIARKHIALYFKIREKNKWKIPQKLETIYFSNELKDYLNKEIKSVEKDIQNYWNSSFIQKGIVKFIKNDFGFIESEGKQFYFNLKNVKPISTLIVVGSIVSFRAQESYDFKKKATSLSALDVRLDS